MEVSQMRYFRAIVEYGSFSEAADHLYITQPALSKSIARLESELGAPLFDRKGSRITLTPGGRALLPYCGTVLDTINSGVTAFQERIGLKNGRVAIGISTEIFIKHLVLEFLQKYPDASLICHLMSQEEMAHALQEGTIDFALSELPVRGDHITWRQIHNGYLTAVLHHDDPLLQEDLISFEDLRDHHFCIGHVRSNLYQAVETMCLDAGFTPKIRYLGYDPDMAGLLLDLPGSVIISPDSINVSIMQTQLGRGMKVFVPIRGTVGHAQIGVAVRSGHYQTEAAKVFCDMVVSWFSSLEEPDDVI